MVNNDPVLFELIGKLIEAYLGSRGPNHQRFDDVMLEIRKHYEEMKKCQ